MKIGGVTKGKDCGSEHFIGVGESMKYNEAILSVRDTHFCIGKVDSGLIQLHQLRPWGLVLIKAGLSECNPVVKNCSAASGSRVELLELVPSVFDGG